MDRYGLYIGDFGNNTLAVRMLRFAGRAVFAQDKFSMNSGITGFHSGASWRSDSMGAPRGRATCWPQGPRGPRRRPPELRRLWSAPSRESLFGSIRACYSRAAPV